MIQARIDEVKLTGQVEVVAPLLTPPYPLPDPANPQPLISAGTGALVGLLIAGGMAAVGAPSRTAAAHRGQSVSRSDGVGEGPAGGWRAMFILRSRRVISDESVIRWPVQS